MMKLKKYILTLVILMAPGWLAAQPPPGPPPDFENGPMREKIRERIQTMKIWKLTEEVGLSSEQSERFFPVYNRYQKALEDLDIKRGELLNRLERMTDDSGSSDKEIEEAVRALNDIPRQILAERDKFFKEISSILPLKQQARLTVFEERFKQRLQQFIREIRHEFRGGGKGDR